MTTEVSTRRLLLAIALVGLWGISTVAAFWWFEFRNLQAFQPEQAVLFDSGSLQDSLAQQFGEAAGPVALHFWDPDCPCTRFNTPHVRDLMAAYAEKGMRFVVLTPTAALQTRAREEFGPQVEIRVAGPLDPLSSPAAVLLDGQGQLAYFGPYSTGANCTTGNGDYVELVLNELDAGNNPRQINTLAVGCFCRWPAA